MNTNRLDGSVRHIAGSAEEALGTLTRDPGLQAEGQLRQLAGKTQAAYGESIEQIADATRKNPLGALVVALGVGFLLGRLL